MDTYHVGIDGGGTKTTAKVIFNSKKPPVFITGGPLNICSKPLSEVKEIIQSMMEQIEQQAGSFLHCAGICAGVAGYSNPQSGPFIKQCIQLYSQCENVKVTSDAYIALCGALGTTTGAIIISGTGSICYGLGKNGESWRTGGAGHLVDDEGSGYYIGRNIISSVIKALDCRESKTILIDLLAEKKNLTSIAQIINSIYNGQYDKSEIASLAPLLGIACKTNDKKALQIAQDAAEKLFYMANTVVCKLHLEESTLACRGSILLKEPYIYNPFKARLQQTFPALQIVTSGGDSVDGAALLSIIDCDSNPLIT